MSKQDQSLFDDVFSHKLMMLNHEIGFIPLLNDKKIKYKKPSNWKEIAEILAIISVIFTPHLKWSPGSTFRPFLSQFVEDKKLLFLE